MSQIALSSELFYLIAERAYILHTAGQHTEACVLFEGLLEAEPDNVYCRDALSAVQLALGNPNEAIRHTNFAISIEPASPRSILRRCEAYLQLRMLPEARRDIEALNRLGAESEAARMELRFKATTGSKSMFVSRYAEKSVSGATPS